MQGKNKTKKIENPVQPGMNLTQKKPPKLTELSEEIGESKLSWLQSEQFPIYHKWLNCLITMSPTQRPFPLSTVLQHITSEIFLVLWEVQWLPGTKQFSKSYDYSAQELTALVYKPWIWKSHTCLENFSHN